MVPTHLTQNKSQSPPPMVHKGPEHSALTTSPPPGSRLFPLSLPLLQPHGPPPQAGHGPASGPLHWPDPIPQDYLLPSLASSGLCLTLTVAISERASRVLYFNGTPHPPWHSLGPPPFNILSFCTPHIFLFTYFLSHPSLSPFSEDMGQGWASAQSLW